jgi:tetratricopeptide (TPR) repeat protein
VSWCRHAVLLALLGSVALAQPGAAGDARQLEQLTATFAIDPRPELLIDMAKVRRKLGQLDEAIANCESFLALVPASPRAAAVVKLIGELRERQRAIARGREAAAEGERLAQAGDITHALEEFQKANFADVEQPHYLLRIADCLRALHRDGEALRDYQLYLAARPSDPERPRIEQAMSELSRPPPKRPVWKRWWFWTALGGVAAAVIAVGVGVGVAERPAQSSSSFMPTLPSFGPSLVIK